MQIKKTINKSLRFASRSAVSLGLAVSFVVFQDAIVSKTSNGVYASSTADFFSEWYEDGGLTTDAVSMTTFSSDFDDSKPTRIFQVHRGNDSRIYTRNSIDGITWTPWSQDGGTTDLAVGIQAFSGKLYQVHRGDDRKIYTRSSTDGINWNPWAESGGTTDKPVNMTTFDGKLYHVHRGDDSYIYSRYSADGTVWSGWERFGTGTTDEDIGVARFDGKLYQVHRGDDRYIYTRSTADGSTWTDWEKYGVGTTDEAVRMTVLDDRLYQVHRGDDRYIYTRSTADGSTWTDWEKYGVGTTDEDIGMIALDGRLYQSHRGDDDRIYTRISDNGKRWIGFNRDSNLWIANSDGQFETQLTADGSIDINYDSVDWKRPGVLSYSRCDTDGCAVLSHEVGSGDKIYEMMLPSEVERVKEIRWSNNYSMLGYIFSKDDDTSQLNLYKNGTHSILNNYGNIPARGGSFEDIFSIEFNPNDIVLVATNTVVELPENPVGAFSTVSLTPIVEVPSGSFGTVNGSNTGFYYKSGDELREQEYIGSLDNKLVNTFIGVNAFNFKTSPGGFFVSYWALSGTDEISMGYYDTGGSPSKIADGYALPQWLDPSSVYLIAQDTSDTLTGIGYDVDGLAKVERVTGVGNLLVTGAIYEFQVEDSIV
jgi:hypothetical protein